MDDVVNPIVTGTHAVALIHRCHLAVGHPFDVTAGTESAAGARQNHGLHVLAGTFLDILKRVADVIAHFRAKRVPSFRSVQCYGRYFFSYVVFDVMVSHSAVSFIRRMTF